MPWILNVCISGNCSFLTHWPLVYIDGLVQGRHNSSALSMELRLSGINPPIWVCTTNCNIQTDLSNWYLANSLLKCPVPQEVIDDKSALVQVMAWCHQVTSHYLEPLTRFCDVIRCHQLAIGQFCTCEIINSNFSQKLLFMALLSPFY